MYKTITFLFALFIFATGASAEELAPKKGCAGDYACGHSDLHKKGVIDHLMKITKSSCCDGGKGGECRRTVSRTPTSRTVVIDGNWCEIDGRLRIHTLPIPGGATDMVVCAREVSEKYLGMYCPIVYCAGRAGPGT